MDRVVANREVEMVRRREPPLPRNHRLQKALALRENLVLTGIATSLPCGMACPEQIKVELWSLLRITQLMDKDLSTARDLWIVTVGKVEDSQLKLGE